MALAQSSLALAADLLAAGLDAALQGVHVVVDSPAATQKLAAGSERHCLNIFLYRIAWSPVHAAQRPGDPAFLRVFALLTPFPGGKTDPSPYPALRILGEVVRHLHENPVSAVLPPTSPGATPCRLQILPMAPDMEELNHIWTTQGSETGYQLSAAYELALLPVDPKAPAGPDIAVAVPVLQVDTGMAHAAERPLAHRPEERAFPPAQAASQGGWSGPARLPRLLAVTSDGLRPEARLTASATRVELAAAGLDGARARIRLICRDGAGSTLREADHALTLATHWIDLPAARLTLPVNLTGAARVEAQITPLDAGDLPFQPERVGAVVHYAVGGGP